MRKLACAALLLVAIPAAAQEPAESAEETQQLVERPASDAPAPQGEVPEVQQQADLPPPGGVEVDAVAVPPTEAYTREMSGRQGGTYGLVEPISPAFGMGAFAAVSGLILLLFAVSMTKQARA